MSRSLDVFPINTATACQFKWTWSTLFLSVGTSSSCHRCKGWDIKDYMHDFHNHPGKIADRQKMLNGQWPGNGCEYCTKIENAGGVSERTSYINGSLLSPKELRTNPTETNVTPRVLEVYFSNLCNQKCVYCSPFFSTQIQAEIEKFGPLEKEYDLMGFTPIPGYEKLKTQFWEWMEINSREIYNFQILGGEPMYQPEFEECLDFFDRHVHPNTNWKIFSNLNFTTDKFIEKIERVTKLVKEKKIESFEIVCSQDCWGPQAEYVRYGTNLEQWEKNFNILMNNSDIKISIHSTITPLTLPTMPEFYRKVMKWKEQKHIGFGWNTVATPTFMNPDQLGHYAKPYFDELLSIIPDDDHRKLYLDGFSKQVTTHKVDDILLNRLSSYLDKIDERRNTNWRELFPYLDEIVKNLII